MAPTQVMGQGPVEDKFVRPKPEAQVANWLATNDRRAVRSTVLPRYRRAETACYLGRQLHQERNRAGTGGYAASQGWTIHWQSVGNLWAMNPSRESEIRGSTRKKAYRPRRTSPGMEKPRQFNVTSLICRGFNRSG